MLGALHVELKGEERFDAQRVAGHIAFTWRRQDGVVAATRHRPRLQSLLRQPWMRSVSLPPPKRGSSTSVLKIKERAQPTFASIAAVTCASETRPRAVVSSGKTTASSKVRLA